MSTVRQRKRAKVLVADDASEMTNLMDYHLNKVGFEVVTADDGAEALAFIDDSFSAILLDLSMPNVDGMQVLEHCRKNHPEISVVIVSAQDDVKMAIEALKLGAVDYITKPFDLNELVAVVRQAVKGAEMTRENQTLRSAISEPPAVSGFVGKSEAGKQTLQELEVISGLDSAVLITGESGVGKGLLARMIHQSSPRADKPFVAVSCPSLPSELIESEMFGHEKGAFTGAHQKKAGKAEMADGGTLFLDEIGDLPLSLQPKLLTFLQDKKFQRVGSTKDREVNVRIIAATNAELKDRVNEGSFREDLYFRLNVFPVEIPPLRMRVDDLEPLCQHILERISRDRKQDRCGIAPEAMALLKAYPWPGNIRELENILERLSAFSKSGVIEVAQLPVDIQTGGFLITPSSARDVSDSSNSGSMSLVGMTLKELEKEAIVQTLDACSGNKAEAARKLGITERSIYNKLDRYGLR